MLDISTLSIKQLFKEYDERNEEALLPEYYY